MLDKTTPVQTSGFMVSCTDHDRFVEVMFGPVQHDHHMRPYRAEKYNTLAKRAWDEREAQIKAAGSVTAWLRSK